MRLVKGRGSGKRCDLVVGCADEFEASVVRPISKHHDVFGDKLFRTIGLLSQIAYTAPSPKEISVRCIMRRFVDVHWHHNPPLPVYICRLLCNTNVIICETQPKTS